MLKKTLQFLLVGSLLCLSISAWPQIRSAPPPKSSAPPSTPEDEIWQVFYRFLAALEAGDASTLAALMWQTPPSCKEKRAKKQVLFSECLRTASLRIDLETETYSIEMKAGKIFIKREQEGGVASTIYEARPGWFIGLSSSESPSKAKLEWCPTCPNEMASTGIEYTGRIRLKDQIGENPAGKSLTLRQHLSFARQANSWKVVSFEPLYERLSVSLWKAKDVSEVKAILVSTHSNFGHNKSFLRTFNSFRNFFLNLSSQEEYEEAAKWVCQFFIDQARLSKNEALLADVLVSAAHSYNSKWISRINGLGFKPENEKTAITYLTEAAQLYEKHQLWKKAGDTVKEMADKSGEDFLSGNLLALYERSAQDYRYAEAKDELSEVLGTMYFMKGLSRMTVGDFDEASTALNRGVRILEEYCPSRASDSDACDSLAGLYLVRMFVNAGRGKQQEAIQDIHQFLLLGLREKSTDSDAPQTKSVMTWLAVFWLAVLNESSPGVTDAVLRQVRREAGNAPPESQQAAALIDALIHKDFPQVERYANELIQFIARESPEAAETWGNMTKEIIWVLTGTKRKERSDEDPIRFFRKEIARLEIEENRDSSKPQRTQYQAYIDLFQGNTEKGITGMREAIRLFEQTPVGIMIIPHLRLSIAQALYDQKREMEALKELQEAKAYYRQPTSNLMALDFYLLEGKALHRLKRLDEAKVALTLAFQAKETERSGYLPVLFKPALDFSNSLAPYQELIALELERGDLVSAFKFSDLLKARLLVDRLDRPAPHGIRFTPKQLSAFSAFIPQLKGLDSQQASRRAKANYEAALYNALGKINDEQKEPSPTTDPGKIDFDQLVPDEQTAIVSYSYLADRIEVFILRRAWASDGAKVITESDIRQGPPVTLTEKTLLLQNGKSELLNPSLLNYWVDKLYSATVNRSAKIFTNPATDKLGTPYQEWAIGLYQALRLDDPSLKGIKNLVVIPDGGLWKLPFAALQDEKGRYLIETFNLSFAPSVNALDRILAKQPQRTPLSGVDSQEVLLVGWQGHPTGGAERWMQQEIKELTTLFPGATTTNSVSLTKSRILEEMSRKSLIHFAAHGKENQNDPLGAQLSLGALDGKKSARRKTRGTDTLDNSLSAWEIMEQDIPAELVVLSACDTRIGKNVAGEGITGLHYAFLLAGSRRVVGTLWQVDSEKTGEIMRNFYQSLKQTKPDGPQDVTQALSEAIRQYIQEHRQRKDGTAKPYYWAALQLIGDPR